MRIKIDDDDLGPDREVEFQTDDEENLADRVFEHLSSETDSEISQPNFSNDMDDVGSPSWPQTYRQSMDMLTGVTPPSMSLIRQMSLLSRSVSPITAPTKRHRNDDSDLNTAFIPETISLIQEDPTFNSSRIMSRLSHFSKYSSCELPPPLEQSSLAQSILNGANVLCGIGLITTPYAVKEGGWLSLIILFMFAIICCYTGILLKRCLENSPGLHTYPDIGQAAFGVAGRLGIAAACVEFIILMSDNLSSLFPNTRLKVAGINLSTNQVFTIASALCVLPTICLRNLKLLSFLSVGGICASILVTTCLLWAGVIDKVGFHPGGKAINLENVSVSIGLYSFCFAGHSVFPNIYSSMREPSKFSVVLAASFGFCLVIYIGVAALGYLTFGDSIKSQFTLNMPKELYASNIAAWTTVVNPLTKYAITLMPVALSIEELLPSAQLRCYSMSVFIRTVLVFTNLVLALSIPFFGSIMAFMGSSMAMLIALIYPCACYLKLHHGRLSKVEVASCMSIIIVGAVCSAVGTYSAVSRIADQEADS
ncbi:amino acid transporter AVT1D-like [Prosopis cineraria]|uniref:amino acid transporter AVT1D-like n=1 Tax=Prosopis cineraria TaxID=364024 RepID=UPI00240ED3D2|nr:amino acid transporter AVT1D-like [Prosopis cineraria]